MCETGVCDCEIIKEVRDFFIKSAAYLRYFYIFCGSKLMWPENILIAVADNQTFRI